MKNSKILLLVEGKKEEPLLFRHFYNLYGVNNVEIISYETNIYAFYNRLKNDYSNSTGEIDFQSIDLPLFLNEYLELEGEELLNESDFTDKILVFDFDPHDPQYSPTKLLELVDSFGNSTDLGKLYLNYPMVESYKDLDSYDIQGFIDREIHIDLLKNRLGRQNQYKVEVRKRTIISGYSDINDEIAKTLITFNKEKFLKLSLLEHYIPGQGHKIVCSLQINKLNSKGYISVLNTSLLHLFDEYGELD